MCGRITLTTPDLATLARLVEAEYDPAWIEEYRPRYNCGPGSRCFVARLGDGRRRLAPARWGLSFGERLAINLRAENASGKGRLRRALTEGRCLVPTDGFFEWREDGGERRPLWFHAPDRSLLLMAGLCQPAPDGDRFAIFTTAPNAVVRPVHDRMPVILEREAAARWLAQGDLALLSPLGDEHLRATPVSTRVNRIDHDDPACLDPLPEGDGSPRQMRLF